MLTEVCCRTLGVPVSWDGLVGFLAGVPASYGWQRSLYVLVSCGSVDRSPLLDSCFADILKMLTGVHSLTLDVLVS